MSPLLWVCERHTHTSFKIQYATLCQAAFICSRLIGQIPSERARLNPVLWQWAQLRCGFHCLSHSLEPVFYRTGTAQTEASLVAMRVYIGLGAQNPHSICTAVLPSNSSSPWKRIHYKFQFSFSLSVTVLQTWPLPVGSLHHCNVVIGKHPASLSLRTPSLPWQAQKPYEETQNIGHGQSTTLWPLLG